MPDVAERADRAAVLRRQPHGREQSADHADGQHCETAAPADARACELSELHGQRAEHRGGQHGRERVPDQARACGHGEGDVERLEGGLIEPPAGRRRARDEHGEQRRAALGAPVGDGQPDPAADHCGQHAAARRGQRQAEHEQRQRAATRHAPGALRGAREPQRGGRRERRVGPDRVGIAEHALESRRGLEELAVRTLLDGVRDQRQRGRAEHPHGGLQRAAQQSGQHRGAGGRCRGHEPAVGVAVGRLRRQRPGDRGVRDQAHGRQRGDVDDHPARWRRPRPQPACRGHARQRTGAQAGRCGQADASAGGAARAADRDGGDQGEPEGCRPSARRVAQGRRDSPHIARIVGLQGESVCQEPCGGTSENGAAPGAHGRKSLKVEWVTVDTPVG